MAGGDELLELGTVDKEIAGDLGHGGMVAQLPPEESADRGNSRRLWPGSGVTNHARETPVPTTLQEQIDEQMSGALPPEVQALIDEMVADLRETNVAPGLEVGATAPDFELPTATGGTLRLSDQLAEGPVVLSFYRGAWCPICNIELRGLQNILGDIARLGASLVAVNPQAPDDSLEFSEKLGLGFAVLSDLDQSVISDYGLQFPLSDKLRPVYEKFGIPLPDQNADGSWNLPIPATYVIAPDAAIVARHVDANYQKRMEPADILAALDGLT